MKKKVFLNSVMFLLLPLQVFGITPVHIGKLYNPDTTIYETSFNWGYSFYPGPLTAGSTSDSYNSNIFLKAYFKKKQ